MTARSLDLKYGLLVVSVFVIALVGFFIFIEYIQLDLAEFAASGLLLLAIVAGTASFFSPCSFPLLATLLARETGMDSASKASTPKALQFATALSVGAIVFLLIMGGLIAAGAGPLMRQVTFTSTVGRILRGLIGTFLIVLGLIQVKGMRFQAADRIKQPLQKVQARLRRRSPFLGFGFFGFGYVLAGFG